ncbi:hypothetical protein AQI95_43205 [Streptomyces yokosukanensis]|uniref:Cytochrome C oxidase subunit I n=1 Tax=Streptomyces yokosukanensis TaxID=67386 RepID=A0A124HCT4_9ACTN|nr:hypothetical protein [Streptomyces yokosukanensis]KUM95466.1 hypothetical protein AQI95_43205 [Streptomyces yokosukanensis]
MTDREERTLVREIEGHLLLAAAQEEGRRAAARTASRLGWLGEAERNVLEREFEAEYVALSRLSWQRTARRAEELRQMYETRYRALRQRLLAWVLLGGALLAAAGLLMVSVAG